MAISIYMPDLLHLFLRITGKLSNLFFRKLQQHDGYSNNDFQNAYKDFLTNTCQINDPIVLDEKKKQKVKDLMGEEFKRMASNINCLSTIFKDLAEIQTLMKKLEGFFKLYEKVKLNHLSHEKLKEDTLNWLGPFLSVFSHEDMTPYIHVFVYHLHEFVQLYGNINLFNLQGLEKKNDIVTTQFHHTTNRHKKTTKSQTIAKSTGVDYLKQLLSINNRLDILSCSNLNKTSF